MFLINFLLIELVKEPARVSRGPRILAEATCCRLGVSLMCASYHRAHPSSQLVAVERPHQKTVRARARQLLLAGLIPLLDERDHPDRALAPKVVPEVGASHLRPAWIVDAHGRSSDYHA